MCVWVWACVCVLGRVANYFAQIAHLPPGRNAHLVDGGSIELNCLGRCLSNYSFAPAQGCAFATEDVTFAPRFAYLDH